MNLKILCRNILNNSDDFNIIQLENYFEQYADEKCENIIEEMDKWLMRQTNLDIEAVIELKIYLQKLIK